MRHFLILAAMASAMAASAQSTTEVRQLTEFRAAYAKTKANLKSHPKDLKAKQAFVVATDRLATATMVAESLPRRTKYVDALRLYREVLKVEPNNREAKNNSTMIESIYRQMGRPIPK